MSTGIFLQELTALGEWMFTFFLLFHFFVAHLHPISWLNEDLESYVVEETGTCFMANTMKFT
jgi:hypothetical protein